MNIQYKFIFACIIIVLSYSYGVLTVQYKIPPFRQLKELQQLLTPDTKQKLNYSHSYYHKKSFFEQHGRLKYDVVFIGDSLTDDANWEDLFPALTIANRGIDGDRTDGVLKRLDSIYSTSAKKAFIMIGINDFTSNVSVDRVFNNYTTIINKLSAHGMNVYIQSTLLTGKRRVDLNLQISELNKRLEHLALQKKAVTFININIVLAPNASLNPMYSRGGVHLNGDGYAVWKNSISQYMQ